jgi:hypothetical protein
MGRPFPISGLVAALCLALLLAGGGRGEAGVARCRTHGQTLARNPVARVYRVAGHRQRTSTIDEDYNAYGCLVGSGKTRRLGGFVGGEPTPDGAYAFALGGRFVGYDRIACDMETCEGRFRVINLRTGATTLGRPIKPRDYMVRADVATPRGNAAWVRQKSNLERYSVHRLEHGRDKELDVGTGIDPRSLHQRGGRVFWTRNGRRKSARLD